MRYAGALFRAYLKHQVTHGPINYSAPAPNFVWQGFDGIAHRLGDLKGHVVVLHFWGAWCPPCRDEFPKMLKAAAANPDIMFLTVANDSAPERPQEFIKMALNTAGVKPLPNVFYAWDPTKSIIYDTFLTVSYPETIIIDTNLQHAPQVPPARLTGTRMPSAPTSWS